MALAVTLAGAPSALGQAGRGDRNCDLSSTGSTPLIDLGTEQYQGATGGLYPNSSNSIPDAHLAVGLRRAQAITPLDADGNPDPAGTIGFASIGMSNTYREFGEFARTISSRSGVDSSVTLVNGAQGGQDLSQWMEGRDRPWEGLDSALADAGVSRRQVQVVWIKLTDRPAADLPFPDTALSYRDKMTELVGQLQDFLPNLQIAYLSSRVYGGYNNTTSPSPEPLAYEEGFGVKWLIERQMNGDPALAADPDSAVVAPWLTWGPYLWADGTTARSDGLSWECRNFRGDGVHPESSGNEKVADLLADFLESEPTAAWMWQDRVLPDPPADPAAMAPPSTIAGDDPAPEADAGSAETTTTSIAEPPPSTETTTASNSGTGDTTPPDTSSPPTGSDTPASTEVPVAGEDQSGSGNGNDPPPWAWMLLGAGFALAVGSGVIWVRSKRS